MTDDGSKYINDAQQRVLRLVILLAGYPVEGIAPGQAAKLNGCTPSDVTRDYANLAHAGLAEKISTTGHMRLGPKLVQIATAHADNLDRAGRRLDEIRQRYSRHD